MLGSEGPDASGLGKRQGRRLHVVTAGHDDPSRRGTRGIYMVNFELNAPKMSAKKTRRRMAA